MIPYKVLLALIHVKEFFPEVVMVVYNSKQQWGFMSEDFKCPDFKGVDINTSVLEDAADVVPQFPSVYQLPDFI